MKIFSLPPPELGQKQSYGPSLERQHTGTPGDVAELGGQNVDGARKTESNVDQGEENVVLGLKK